MRGRSNAPDGGPPRRPRTSRAGKRAGWLAAGAVVVGLEAALILGTISAEDFDQLVQPHQMVGPRQD